MPAERKFNALMAAAAAVAVVLLCWLYSTTGRMLPCLFKLATGWSCPGCGSQRALHALLRGDLYTALTVNLLLPFMVAYLLLLVVTAPAAATGHPRAAARLNDRLTSPGVIFGVAAAIVAWTVVRNLLNI